MGFVVPRPTDITLEFGDDSALDGATIRCRSMPLGRTGETDELRLPEWVAYAVENVIIEWDLEATEGEPLPVSVESFDQLPGWLPMAIRNAWVTGLMTPPGPLEPPSSSGGETDDGPIRQASSA